MNVRHLKGGFKALFSCDNIVCIVSQPLFLALKGFL